ncbi:MAG: hypothetical protein IPP06_04140 [Saprospiraceae bacterium]|nr:hypothetical protein [Candidatus Vicinibacter affinis]
MKNQSFIILSLLVAAGIGFWWWNSNRIQAMKLQLAQLQSQPPARYDKPGWTQVIQLLISLGKDVYAEFQPGGAFYRGSNTITSQEIQDIIRSFNGFKP